MADEITCLIVDDHEVVREGLRLSLSRASHIRVVGEASDGQSAVELVERRKPRVVVMDVRMPGMDGLELQVRLNELKLEFAVVIMTGHGDVPMAVRAMRAGAVDFVEKPFAEEAILDSVTLAQSRLERSQGMKKAAAVARARLELLSPREREVLEGLVAGLPNKTIAADLAISPRTVEIHRARVIEKMQARSLSELVRLALAAGVEIKG
jgi:two-component system response regulator FixJ